MSSLGDWSILGQIDAIGVDEIQYSKGHKYLTLVYRIDLGVTRLLSVGKERTIESFQGFANIGSRRGPRGGIAPHGGRRPDTAIKEVAPAPQAA
jgi:hypothetical protein